MIENQVKIKVNRLNFIINIIIIKLCMTLPCKKKKKNIQWKFCWNFKLKLTETINSQAIQEVDECVSALDQQVWRNWALHHFLTNGHSAVNGCRQNGAVQTANKNITTIHK